MAWTTKTSRKKEDREFPTEELTKQTRRDLEREAKKEARALQEAAQLIDRLKEKLGLQNWRCVGMHVCDDGDMTLNGELKSAIVTRERITRNFTLRFRRGARIFDHKEILAVVVAHELAHLVLVELQSLFSQIVTQKTVGSEYQTWVLLWREAEERTVEAIAEALVGRPHPEVARKYE